MQPLEVAIQLSDLYEAAGVEGGTVAVLIDKEIMPFLAEDKFKGGIGLGDRFSRVMDKVRASANRTGKDSVRTLKDMMKSALVTYIQKTQDAVTGRMMYHRAIMSGSDTMLTVTAAVILANALLAQHPDEAKTLVSKVASQMTGRQSAMENSSGAAVGAGAIATTNGKKKKPRKDSIFAEGGVIPFSQENSVKSPFQNTRDIAKKFGWVAVAQGPIGKSEHFVVQLHDPKGSGRPPMWIYSNGKWEHRGMKGQDAAELEAYLHEADTLYDHIVWNDLIGNPALLETVTKIAESGCNKQVDGVLVDPTTAELVVAVHKALSKKSRKTFENKTIQEMIEIAHRCIQRGLIQVVMEEA